MKKQPSKESKSQKNAKKKLSNKDLEKIVGGGVVKINPKGPVGTL